jgi:hypothetical protein
VSAEKKGLPRKRLGLIGAGALVVIAALFFLFGKSPIDRAIDDAANAKTDERRGKIDAAKKLIAAEHSAKDRSWYLGQLSEKLGETAAAGHYAAAARAGSRDAENQLIKLLGHQKCQLRSAAADALEGGGPGDGEQVLVFGCNSKQAATTALQRLNKD